VLQCGIFIPKRITFTQRQLIVATALISLAITVSQPVITGLISVITKVIFSAVFRNAT